MKIAVSKTGLQRPLAASTIALISSRVGMSTPTLSLPFWRRSAFRSTPRARVFRRSRTTLRETSPRSCASLSRDDSETRTLRTIARVLG